MTAKHYIVLTLAFLFLLFILQNTGPVAARLLFWHISMSLALWLILGFTLGMLVGVVISRAYRKSSGTGLK
jgi:uncharacterized integral membrane protein